MPPSPSGFNVPFVATTNPSMSALSPVTLKAAGTDFRYALTLEADRSVVLQGDGGFSRKSERGQASYYYSQPFFRARGSIIADG